MGRRTSELAVTETAHRIRTEYQQVLRGIRLPIEDEVTFADRRRAVMQVYPAAVFCGWTAARMHAVPYADGDRPLELWLPEHRRRDGLVIRRCAMPPSDILQRKGFALTSEVRTAIDLARFVDGDEAIAAVDQCIRVDRFGRLVTSVDEMERYLSSHPRLHRSSRVRRVLAEVDGRAESPQETRARLLLHRAGLTVFEPQVKIARGRYRVDLGAEEFRVAVEYDGGHHRDRDQHRRDVQRWNRLQNDHGWTVVLANDWSLSTAGRPELLRQTRKALYDRGWTPR
ncbi:endonuclease domain-containing protein [Tsukamurella ocularis]|uniref:endonuclease domain-containing protein n=1 Tax=Tsukamurella ocularis TaxID=1970234 RepID=UPI0039F07595